MGLTIKIDTPSHLLVAKPSSTKPRRYRARGHREEQMPGIWGLRRTTIDAICNLYRRRALTESRDRPNSSHNTARSQI
jgi:hypothetical protein